MIEKKKAVPAASVDAERGGNCSMLAEIQAELYGEDSRREARQVDAVCSQLANLRKWAGPDLQFTHGAVSQAVKQWNSGSAPFREAIKQYLAAYEKAANSGGGSDGPTTAAEAARMAAIRNRQLAAKLSSRFLSALSGRLVGGAGAPPEDVLNIVIKLSAKAVNERLAAANYQETLAESEALDAMWPVW